MANNTVIMMASKNGAVVIAHVRSHHSCGQPRFNSRSRTICELCLLFDSRPCQTGFTVGTPVKPSPQKGGVCGREVNTTNSGGPGLKPRPSPCFLRQLILLHFVSLHPGV